MSETNSGGKIRRIMVTAGLPYSNGRLHVGHIAGAYLPADIYVRFLRLRGMDTCFVCGSDDHGVAIMMTAQKEGKTPGETAKYYNERQREDFAGLGIEFDVYGSTSQNPFHAATSQGFFRSLYEQDYFKKKKTRQFYDEARKIFLPDRYVTGICSYCGAPGQHGDQCENCGRMLDVDTLLEAKSAASGQPASVRETVHWFLDLSRFAKDVEGWLEHAVLRDYTRTYVKGLLSAGLVERSMTRDIDWGIPLSIEDPDAKGKVLYVWFDAPIGYISNTKQFCATREGDPERYADWWKSDDSRIIHFVGEDNTIFHCVIWIAMLKAERTFRLPYGVIVNQFLNIKFPGKEEEKISKSRGSAVWIGDYLAEGGDPDSLRYYLAMIAPEKSRTVYKPEDLMQRHNSELANNLGNFVHRIISFTHKYAGGKIPERLTEKIQERDRTFAASFESTFKTVTANLENFAFRAALEALMEFCRGCNRYVDDKAPWATRKTDMETTNVTLAYGLEAIHFLAVTLMPFMPFAARKIAAMLNLDQTTLRWEDALNPSPAGTGLNEAQILFTKIEV